LPIPEEPVQLAAAESPLPPDLGARDDAARGEDVECPALDAEILRGLLEVQNLILRQRIICHG
jgi:hypothetical protein